MYYATCEILLDDIISMLFYIICINISLIDENRKIKIYHTFNLFLDKVSYYIIINSKVFNHTVYV